jgi:hypothetical protein
MIMRKIAFGVLFGLSLSASAGITEKLSTMPLSEAYAAASAECGGNCDAEIASELATAGYTASDIIAAAIAAGVDATALVEAASAAALDSGASVEAVMAAVLAIPGIPADTAVSGVMQASVSRNISVAAVMSAAKSNGVPEAVIVAGALESGQSNQIVQAATRSLDFNPNSFGQGVALAATNTGNATAAGGPTSTAADALQDLVSSIVDSTSGAITDPSPSTLTL